VPARKKERDQFFDSELAYLLRASSTNIIVGGDFNCYSTRKTALVIVTRVERSTD
jgi:endonuclease/exonuclease/phosphatase (EEP) superfamily protein YafD